MPVSVAAPARGVMSGPRGNAPERKSLRKPGRRSRTECAGCITASFTRLEGERQHLGHADFGAVGQGGLGAVGEPAPVQPSAVAALIGDGERPGDWVAAEAQMLARDLVVGVEWQVDPEALAAAPHADFVLRDEVSLRAGIVVVADLGVDPVGLAARTLAVAYHARGGHRGLPLDQRRFRAAIPGLGDVVPLGVDLDIAGRNGFLAVAEQLDPPGALCDSILFADSAAAEERDFLGPLRHAVGEGAAGVLSYKVLPADQAVVIVGVQVDAEETGQQDAVAQFQTPQFHVAD